ncbi:MAG: hypothetical protein NC938_02095 [Candidatus Omnitrophica bacterium]|nr:hypothetical protein [Candidatus Omnitrophota bacterium]
MAKELIWVLSAMGIIVILGMPLYAEDAKIGRDDFFSSSIAAVFDKISEYTSGQKRIISKDAMGADSEDRYYYEEDALGRQVPKARPKLGRDAALNEPI